MPHRISKFCGFENLRPGDAVKERVHSGQVVFEIEKSQEIKPRRLPPGARFSAATNSSAQPEATNLLQKVFRVGSAAAVVFATKLPCLLRQKLHKPCIAHFNR